LEFGCAAFQPVAWRHFALKWPSAGASVPAASVLSSIGLFRSSQLVMFFKRPGGQLQFSRKGEAAPLGRSANPALGSGQSRPHARVARRADREQDKRPNDGINPSRASSRILAHAAAAA